MKIAVDPTACLHTGICVSLAPHHFTLDHTGTMHLSTDHIPPHQHAQVTAAVHACPTAALSLQQP
ncbi:ferredoxin [Nocardia ninae]|uniref:Ferredoxin n=1 Tax=Nocardia ninae NBRC 108245 TaxID=1210091 RepID=A0A511MDB9_9NOCA|nr:ferredoxin [Nocardia ninae]GEM38471.1 hypothetical protein NN4_29900 [Nocardia ninae NBRC 108245]